MKFVVLRGVSEKANLTSGLVGQTSACPLGFVRDRFSTTRLLRNHLAEQNTPNPLRLAFFLTTFYYCSEVTVCKYLVV